MNRQVIGKRSLMGFAGVFSGKEASELEANIKEARKASKKRAQKKRGPKRSSEGIKSKKAARIKWQFK